MAISPRFAIRTFRIIGSIIYPAAPASNELIWILSVKLPIDYAQKREVLPYSETGNLPMRATLVCPYVFWEHDANPPNPPGCAVCAVGMLAVNLFVRSIKRSL